VASSRGSAPVLLPTVDVDRPMKSWAIPPAALDAVRAAVSAHRQRVIELASEPAALLRRLEPILTPSELADFAAATKRHRPTLLARAH
jgi:hypothetical protein